MEPIAIELIQASLLSTESKQKLIDARRNLGVGLCEDAENTNEIIEDLEKEFSSPSALVIHITMNFQDIPSEYKCHWGSLVGHIQDNIFIVESMIYNDKVSLSISMKILDLIKQKLKVKALYGLVTKKFPYLVNYFNKITTEHPLLFSEDPDKYVALIR